MTIIAPRRAGLLALAFAAALTAPPAGAEIARRTPEGMAEIQLSFSPVVKAAAPAVVNIYARRVVTRRPSPFAGNPFFERFFGQAMPQGRRVENALGSGVIVTGDGLVLLRSCVVPKFGRYLRVTPPPSSTTVAAEFALNLRPVLQRDLPRQDQLPQAVAAA